MKNKKIFAWSITVALAGFLFGFDTVVISGADLELQKLWPQGDWFHGFVVMSSALWGTVIGAIFGGIPTEKLGRKKTLIIIGILYSLSAIGAALVSDPFSFAFFRFIGGLGVGASTIAGPAYISEIAPAENRGKLVGTYQFNIVFGILVAFLSNYLISEAIQNDAWRYMIGIEAIPAIIYTLMVLSVPESPRWLITAKNDTAEATKVLSQIYPTEEVPAVIKSIQDNNEAAAKGESIFMEKYQFPLRLAFLIAFFNQFSGISVHWVLAAIIPAMVPVLFAKLGQGPVFYFFAFMMFLQLIFVYKMMPETKGVVLEEMQDSLGQ